MLDCGLSRLDYTVSRLDYTVSLEMIIYQFVENVINKIYNNCIWEKH